MVDEFGRGGAIPEESRNKRDRKDAPPPPIGLIVSFLSGLLILLVTGILRFSAPRISAAMTESRAPEDMLLVLVLVVLVRHQLRVVFIDSSDAAKLGPLWQKVAVISLIPLAILGGITWLSFGLHNLLGAVVMLAYSLGFACFWIIVMTGTPKSVRADEKPKGAPLLADIGLVVFWIYYIRGFEDGIPPAVESFVALVIVVLMLLAHEIYATHREPLKERLTASARQLFERPSSSGDR